MKQSLADWLKERRDNALRIAESKIGRDKAGWIEDAEYFDEAISMLQVAEHRMRGDQMWRM